MKIAIIPHCVRIFKTSSGYNKRIYHLAEGLEKRGHTVYLFGAKGSRASFNIHKYNLPEKSLEYKYHYLSDALKQVNDKVDIVNFQTDHLALPFTAFAKPKILHTIIYGAFSPSINWLFKQNADLNYSTISNFMAKKYNYLNMRGVVYNGIDANAFKFNNQPKDYFLTMSRLEPIKGIAEAVQLAKKLNFKLLIAGGSSDQNYFKKFIKPYLNKNIQYLGQVDFKQKIPLYQNALGLLHFNKTGEGFGNSMVEAMMCGTPVIGFNKGSIPELIINNKTGYVCKDESNAISAIKNIEKIERIDCRNHAVKNFSIDSMVDSYEKLYKKIIKNK